MILEDLIHEICLIVNSIQDTRENEGKSIWRDELPQDYVELLES